MKYLKIYWPITSFFFLFLLIYLKTDILFLIVLGSTVALFHIAFEDFKKWFDIRWRKIIGKTTAIVYVLSIGVLYYLILTPLNLIYHAIKGDTLQIRNRQRETLFNSTKRTFGPSDFGIK
jgi:cellulose synthase/poly-beta-1,6-N-acetylglucosamine synthase-like glycosyltransferase